MFKTCRYCIKDPKAVERFRKYDTKYLGNVGLHTLICHPDKVFSKKRG